MNDRFAQNVRDRKVRHDMRVLADFVRIYCDAHHAGDSRRPAETDATECGVYSRKRPTLCADCEAHLAYAEKRRAYCSRDPKPFCAHCDSQCYKDDELLWQRQMMRFSGPRSAYQGHAIDGIKHAIEAFKWRRTAARRTN